MRAAFGKVPGSDGGIMVCMTSNCKKTTINLMERTRRSQGSMMMALGMKRRHQVDCPGSGTPKPAFCRQVAPKCSN